MRGVGANPCVRPRVGTQRTWELPRSELGDCPCCFAWNPGNRGTVPMFAVFANQKKQKESEVHPWLNFVGADPCVCPQSNLYLIQCYSCNLSVFSVYSQSSQPLLPPINHGKSQCSQQPVTYKNQPHISNRKPKNPDKQIHQG